MNYFSLSIVTPSFNRKDVICASIESSLALINKGQAKELVVIDDASKDGTYEMLLANYKNEISLGIMQIHRLERNIGVTGAKNKGAELASGEWIAFMDSDDIFLPNSGELIKKDLSKYFNYELIFFRCSDLLSKNLIGNESDGFNLTMRHLFNCGTPGECLPIIKRNSILLYPYNTALRGGESLAYYKMLSNKHSAYVSDKVVRGYDTSGDD